jgi:hypothetical protein
MLQILPVKRDVFFARNDCEILHPIVLTIAVLVMNQLVTTERAPNVFFHYETMLKHLSFMSVWVSWCEHFQVSGGVSLDTPFPARMILTALLHAFQESCAGTTASSSPWNV